MWQDGDFCGRGGRVGESIEVRGLLPVLVLRTTESPPLSALREKAPFLRLRRDGGAAVPHCFFRFLFPGRNEKFEHCGKNEDRRLGQVPAAEWRSPIPAVRVRGISPNNRVQ